MATTKSPMTESAIRAHQDALIRAWNAHDVDRILEHLSDDVVWIQPMQVTPFHGKEAVAAYLKESFTAFPDMHLPVDDLQVVTSLDPPFYVATWTATATMTGAAQGLPATGASVRFSGTTVCRFRDGLINEYQQTYDALDVMQQLGALPKTEGLGFKAVAMVNVMLGRAKKALHR